ncbi:MAG: hypothetical protein ACU0DK_13615 [Pseudooceanicola sp.]
MKLRTTLTAAVLAILPAMSFASCNYHEKQVSSCAEGYVWDSEAEACVQQITG